MAAIVSTRIIALQAISPRQGTAPVIEKMAVPTINGTGFQGGQTDYDTGTGFFLGYSGAAYKLSIGNAAGNKLTWDGTDLSLTGTITAAAGSIGGWTINADYLAKDTGVDATSAGMAPLDYPFFAGATYANRASAPFRVNPAGEIIGANYASAASGKRIDIGATNAGELQFYADTGGGVEQAATIGIRTVGGSDFILVAGTGTATNVKNGIYGLSYNSDAVRGQAFGGGVGVLGYSATGYAGYFESSGVLAGVRGSNTSSGQGVVGDTSAGTGIAGYFAGNTSASALRAIGGTGQYALELTGTGTASMTALFTPAIKTVSGALTITPAAGSGLNVALSTTGDFAVNTNQLVVDTSTGNVGIGTTGPLAKLAINGGLHVGGDSDPGDNNALIDGTLGVTGLSTLTGGAKFALGTFAQFDSDTGANQFRIAYPTNGNLKLVVSFNAGAEIFSINNSGNTAVAGTLGVTGETTFGSRANLKSYTVATLPAAGAAAGVVYASDAGGNGPCIALSDGSVWKRCDNTSTTVT